MCKPKMSVGVCLLCMARNMFVLNGPHGYVCFRMISSRSGELKVAVGLQEYAKQHFDLFVHHATDESAMASGQSCSDMTMLLGKTSQDQTKSQFHSQWSLGS